MEQRKTRLLALGGGIAILFVVTVVILLNVIPGPHRKLDYLVIGAVATFLSMILLWVVLVQGWLPSTSAPAKDDPVPPAD